MLSGSSIYNSFAAGSVNGTSDVGRLVGSNNNGTIENSFAVLQGSHPLVGVGGYDGAGDTTVAAMKDIQTYRAVGWDIVLKDNVYPYPLLGWQVGVTTIWVIPGVAPELGDGDFAYFDFTFTLPGITIARGDLTAIPGNVSNPVITADLITGGSAADLGRALAAYIQAQQYYEAHYGNMSAAERAVAEVELAIANAAILALELALAAQNGQAVDITALIAAYQAAQAALNNNRGLLSADQVAKAQALMNAIASVIGRFSS